MNPLGSNVSINPCLFTNRERCDGHVDIPLDPSFNQEVFLTENFPDYLE